MLLTYQLRSIQLHCQTDCLVSERPEAGQFVARRALNEYAETAPESRGTTVRKGAVL